jgi:hypothetical protein
LTDDISVHETSFVSWAEAFFLLRLRKEPRMAKRLTVQERKDIFLQLVTLQDSGKLSIGESKQQMIRDFEITESQLEQIIEEGTDKEWPPFDVIATSIN